LTLLAACGNARRETGSNEPVPLDETASGVQLARESYMRCLYYEEEQFQLAVAEPQRYEADGKVLAGVVPHHLLASDMIAGFFSLAAQPVNPYDRVILIAPSHYPQNCGSDFVTAATHWNTPFGVVRTDSEFVEALLEDALIGAGNNAQAVEADHGAAGLIPFIAHYLPGVTVGICLVAGGASLNRLEALQALVADACGDGRTLLVASVDFSHYLTVAESERMDSETWRAVESFDYGEIMAYDDRHVDSPQALGTFMQVLEALDLDLVQLDHSSSALKLPHAETNPIFYEGLTTYFILGGVWE